MIILITNLEQLDFLIELNTDVECFIALKGGVKSTKVITKNKKGNYRIVNGIDDSVDTVSKETIYDEAKTNVGLAMKKGWLWFDSSDFNLPIEKLEHYESLGV